MSIKDIFFDDRNIKNLVDVLKKETDMKHTKEALSACKKVLTTHMRLIYEKNKKKIKDIEPYSILPQLNKKSINEFIKIYNSHMEHKDNVVKEVSKQPVSKQPVLKQAVSKQLVSKQPVLKQSVSKQPVSKTQDYDNDFSNETFSPLVNDIDENYYISATGEKVKGKMFMGNLNDPRMLNLDTQPDENNQSQSQFQSLSNENKGRKQNSEYIDKLVSERLSEMKMGMGTQQKKVPEINFCIDGGDTRTSTKNPILEDKMFENNQDYDEYSTIEKFENIGKDNFVDLHKYDNTIKDLPKHNPLFNEKLLNISNKTKNTGNKYEEKKNYLSEYTSYFNNTYNIEDDIDKRLLNIEEEEKGKYMFVEDDNLTNSLTTNNLTNSLTTNNLTNSLTTNNLTNSLTTNNLTKTTNNLTNNLATNNLTNSLTTNNLATNNLTTNNLTANVLTSDKISDNILKSKINDSKKNIANKYGLDTKKVMDMDVNEIHKLINSKYDEINTKNKTLINVKSVEWTEPMFYNKYRFTLAEPVNTVKRINFTKDFDFPILRPEINDTQNTFCIIYDSQEIQIELASSDEYTIKDIINGINETLTENDIPIKISDVKGYIKIESDEMFGLEFKKNSIGQCLGFTQKEYKNYKTYNSEEPHMFLDSSYFMFIKELSKLPVCEILPDGNLIQKIFDVENNVSTKDLNIEYRLTEDIKSNLINFYEEPHEFNIELFC